MGYISTRSKVDTAVLEVKLGGGGIIFYNRYIKDIDDLKELERIKDRIIDAKVPEDITR